MIVSFYALMDDVRDLPKNLFWEKTKTHEYLKEALKIRGRKKSEEKLKSKALV